MSNTIKVLINKDGITGREQNPHMVNNMPGEFFELAEWSDFEATVKSYIVVGSGFKAGDMVEVEIVWLYLMGQIEEWCITAYPENRNPELTWKQSYKVVEAKPEKSEGCVHRVTENDSFKIKRLEATVEMLRRDNYERFIDLFEYEIMYTKQDIKRIIKSI